jgi:hypothetical protein
MSADCLPAAAGNSLAAVAMGIYYTLAAYQENRKFFIATVPMRCLTAVVFWRQAWIAPAVWEGTGAVLTAVALWLGSRKMRKKNLSMQTYLQYHSHPSIGDTEGEILDLQWDDLLSIGHCTFF